MSEKSEQVLIKDRVSTPAGSKKVVFRLRSVSSIVMPAARTGRDSRSSTAVISTDQTNRGVWY